MDEKFLDKFFRLYSKCSKLYAELSKIDDCLIISYWKHNKLAYPYQYIDFNLLFCTRSGKKDYSNNTFLQSEFEVETTRFLINKFQSTYYGELSILRKLKKIIDGDFHDLQKETILSLNDIYINALKLK
jgi:hypothetical protein